jgi:hypothetical protein
MNRTQIEALPDDPRALKMQIVKMSETIASLEKAKAERAAAEVVAASSPAANFDMAVFNAKASLEGLQDGSEDITDPLVRGTILRGAIKLIGDLFDALKADGKS